MNLWSLKSVRLDIELPLRLLVGGVSLELKCPTRQEQQSAEVYGKGCPHTFGHILKNVVVHVE